jgi:hypothetical protein
MSYIQQCSSPHSKLLNTIQWCSLAIQRAKPPREDYFNNEPRACHLILSSSKIKKALMGFYHLEIHQRTCLLWLPLIKWSLQRNELYTLLN